MQIRRKKLNEIIIDKDNPEIAYIHIKSKTHGQFKVKIDADDINLVNGYTWGIKKFGHNWYTKTNITLGHKKQEEILLHRLIMDFPDKGLDIDHRSGDTTDNCRSNLRICSHQENIQNKKSVKGSSSKYKGCCFVKRSQKFQVYIKVGSKNIYLGLFEDEDEAGRCYNRAAKKYYGEFARLNKIQGDK